MRIVVLALVVGCGEPSSLPVADAVVEIDASYPVDGPCTIPVDRSTGSPVSRLLPWLNHLHDAGLPHATGGVGPDRIYLGSLFLAYPPWDDAREGVLNWLASLPANPFDPDELVARDPTWGAGYGTMIIERMKVDDRPARFIDPVVTARLAGNPSNWQIHTVEISSSVAWATPAEIAALEACAPVEPPTDAAIRRSTLRGRLRPDCTWGEEYEYVPAAVDAIEWSAETKYGALDRWGGYEQDAVRWRVQRPALLRLDDTSTFPGIEVADATCGGVTGYRIVSEALTGEILRSTPGIDCSRCQ